MGTKTKNEMGALVPQSPLLDLYIFQNNGTRVQRMFGLHLLLLESKMELFIDFYL
jgi:hypothetical protein